MRLQKLSEVGDVFDGESGDVEDDNDSEYVVVVIMQSFGLFVKVTGFWNPIASFTQKYKIDSSTK